MPRIKQWKYETPDKHAQLLRENDGYGGDLHFVFFTANENAIVDIDDVFLALEEHGSSVTALSINFINYLSGDIAFVYMSHVLERFAENGWFGLDDIRLVVEGAVDVTSNQVTRFMSVLSRFAIQVLGMQVFPRMIQTFASLLPELRALEYLSISTRGGRNWEPLFSALGDYSSAPTTRHIGSKIGLEAFRILEMFLGGTPRLRVLTLRASHGLSHDEQASVLRLLERAPRLIVQGSGIEAMRFDAYDDATTRTTYATLTRIKAERGAGVDWREFA